mgnify:CR=1 FL=1
MHIPDGYVDLPIALLFGALSVAVLSLAARRVDGEITDARAPLLGVVAAGVFAAQMLNWPIPGGTSAVALSGIVMATTRSTTMSVWESLCIAGCRYRFQNMVTPVGTAFGLDRPVYAATLTATRNMWR